MEETHLQPGIPPLLALNVALPERPLLAPWLSIVDLEPGRIQFRGGNFCYTLHHEVFCSAFRAVQELLDGNSSTDSVIGFSTSFLPTTIEVLLRTLRANCILFDAKLSGTIDAALKPAYSILAHYSSRPEWGMERVRLANISAVGSPQLCAAFSDAMQDWGGTVVTETCVSEAFSKSELVVVCGSSTDRGLFLEANKSGLALHKKWIRVAMQGTLPVLGPTVIPWQSACLSCFEHRSLSHASAPADEASYYSQFPKGALQVFPSNMVNLLASHAALEVVRLVSGFAPPATIGRVIELPITSTDSIAHDVFRMPRCGACSHRLPTRSPWDFERLSLPL